MLSCELPYLLMRPRNFVHFPLLAVHLEINNYAKATVVAPQDAKTILLPAKFVWITLLRSSEHFERTPLPQFRVAITFETINKRSFKIIIIIQYSGKQARIWHFLIEIPLFGARIVPPTIPFTRRHCVTELLLSWPKTVTFGLQCLLWNQQFPNSALLSMI